MKISEEFKITKALEILKIKTEISYETKQFLLNEIIKYLFNTKYKTKTEKQVFDYEYDYKYYFYDFLKLGINLNKDDISWWEFDSILGGLFLEKHSAIGQVIQYRTYEKPTKNQKVNEQKEEVFYREKKKQYELPKVTYNIDEGLSKLWGYAESQVKKVGDDL